MKIYQAIGITDAHSVIPIDINKIKFNLAA